jgi:hypothetical protein
MNLRPLRLTVAALALTAILSGCNADCPACSSLQNPPQPLTSTFAFTLCVSEVPRIERGDRGCGDIEVQFTAAGD